LAFKSQLTIPLTLVHGATADPEIAENRSGRRGPGTCVPGVVSAGTFHQHRERIFWDVHSANAVVIGPRAREVTEADHRGAPPQRKRPAHRGRYSTRRVSSQSGHPGREAAR